MDEEEIVFEDSEPIEYVPDYQSINTKSDKNLAEKIDSVKQKKAFEDSVRDAISNKKSNSSDNKMNQAQELQKSKIENARKNSNLNSNKKGNNQMVNKLASGALTKAGIPKPASDALVNSKAGQKAIEAAKTKVPALNAIDKLSKFVNKDEEDYESKGVENVSFSLKNIKTYIIVFSAVLCILIIFCFFIITPQVVIKVVGEGNAEKLTNPGSDEKIQKEMDKDDFIDSSQDVAFVSLNNNFSKNKLMNSNLVLTSIERDFQESDLSKLKEFYGSSVFNINSSNSKYVYQFYFKLFDLYNRYESKYKVSIDLALLMSTLYIESDDVSVVFEKNAKDYNHNDVKNKLSDLNSLIELDYEYDWTDKYKISHSDSSHDIEILAQNMVSKNEDDGYKYDEEKYKDFLKGFIEKKYYLDSSKSYDIGSSVSSNNSNNYNSISNIDAGDWKNWKQCGEPWSNLIVPNSSSTFCQIGCLLTSISIQIKRSGVPLSVDNFNPGITLKYFNFSTGGSLSYYTDVSKIAPNFKYDTSIVLSGLSASNIINKLKQYDDGKHYIVYGVSLKDRNQLHHFVAMDYIDYNSNEIHILDPDPYKNYTNLTGQYKVYKAVIFKVE